MSAGSECGRASTALTYGTAGARTVSVPSFARSFSPAPRMRLLCEGTLTGYGVAQVIECGPGKVLTTLNRRIERRPDLSFLALEDPASIDTALSATGAASHA